MKARIIKTTVNDSVVYMPQWKPNLLVQVLQLNFEWRWFYTTHVNDNERRKRHMRKLEDAIKFIEGAPYKDPFSKLVVWVNGKVVSDDNRN